MKGLLIVLCAVAVLVAVFAGGCAGLITFFFPSDRAWTVPAIVAALAILTINVALIVAVCRGTVPRRRPLFVILAILDLVAAVYLAAVAWSVMGSVTPIVLSLVPGFFAKGLLVFALPDEATPDNISGEPPRFSRETGVDSSVES